MSKGINHTADFLKGLTSLTGLSYRKVQQYAKENNPFNILEHPGTIEPNERQLEKIGLLDEFISLYNVLKTYENENRKALDSSAKAGQYFVSLLRGMKDRERVVVAFLDNSHNIIETRTVSEGMVGEATVYPRDVLRAALTCDCKAIILAHNHPGMSTTPSNADKLMTQPIVDIFAPLDIKVLDHVIVGGNEYCSMAEKGYINQTSTVLANYEPIVMDKGARMQYSRPELENEDEMAL